MTCPDIAQLLDAFVDTELPPPQLLDVARHAASCSECDKAIRDLTELRQSVAALVERAGRELDLSGVWPAISARVDAPARRPARVVALTRVPAAPVWGALMAMAASVVFWFNQPPPQHVATRRVAARQVASQPHTVDQDIASQLVADQQIASLSQDMAPARAMRPSNHAYIDRLAGKDIAVRREPKSGTTIIWVNHTTEEPR